MCLAADFNGDGANDVLLSGEADSFFTQDAKLHLNDGAGNFTVQQTSFLSIERMHMTSGDVDVDGDIDIYMSGWASGEWVHALYLNDGDANFTSANIPNIVATDFGFSKLIDLDGDSDLDLFVTGRNSELVPTTTLYLNDGTGGFTPFDSALEPLQQSTAAFGDLDDDGDLDIIIAGYNTALQRVCLTYIITESGYELLPNFALPEFANGTLDLGDVDQDGDLDLLFTGQVQGANYSSGVFTNNGSGSFTALATGIVGAYLGSGYFADIDNDTDLDIVINGNTGVGVFETEVYVNENGSFTNSGNDIVGSDYSKLLIADLNNDDFVDILVTGRRNGISSTRIAQLYLNNGNGGFSLVNNSPFAAFGEFAKHGDLDGDGDLDVVICGIDMYDLVSYTRIYLNDGFGNYTHDTANTLAGMRGEIDIIDFDADGDLDIAICGNSVTSFAEPQLNVVIYRNDGTGGFDLWATLPGVNRSIAWADVDGDADLDFIITGGNNSGTATTILYLQNANNTFTASAPMFEQLRFSDVHFFDCDNDGDMDVMLAGDSSLCFTQLYINDGAGNYAASVSSNFTALSSTPQIGSTDVNNDGFLDLIILGEQCSLGFNCDVYLNDGTGQFSLSQTLPGDSGTKLELIDMNNDGLDDILFSSQNSGTSGFSLIYYPNDGTGNFEIGTTNLLDGVIGFFTVFDADADGDNDIVIPGYYRKVAAGFFKNVTGEIVCTPTASTDVVTSCGEFTWINGVTYIQSNFSDTITLTNALGCDSVITLNLTIEDIVAPIPDLESLPAVNAQCELTELTAPMATDDCVGSVTGTHNASFPITASTTVVWTYDDGNGNSTTQEQSIVIADTTAPVPDQGALSEINSECEVGELSPPTATDNCAGSITGTHNANFPITASTTVVWTYDDGNGNTSTQEQSVNISPIDNTVALTNAVTLTANASGYSYQWVDCGSGVPIDGETAQSFVASASGEYGVVIDNGSCSVSSACTEITIVGIAAMEHAGAVKVYPNPTSGTLFIENLDPSMKQLTVFNALGQAVAEHRLNAHGATITLILPEANGVYFLGIETGTTRHVERIVKQ